METVFIVKIILFIIIAGIAYQSIKTWVKTEKDSNNLLD
jgi:hypothetical protein